jgi:hypothetical protein
MSVVPLHHTFKLDARLSVPKHVKGRGNFTSAFVLASHLVLSEGWTQSVPTCILMLELVNEGNRLGHPLVMMGQ